MIKITIAVLVLHEKSVRSSSCGMFVAGCLYIPIAPPSFFPPFLPPFCVYAYIYFLHPQGCVRIFVQMMVGYTALTLPSLHTRAPYHPRST
jgi:hypothetical protein